MNKILKKAIDNDADLDIVKHLYKSRNQPLVSLPLLAKITLYWTRNAYYNNSHSLSYILQNLKTELYLVEKDQIEQDLITKIDKIIEANDQLNPFDKLQFDQRYLFENVRTKLSDGGYEAIQSDINKLADELYNKNVLVDKYLKDSKTSYWISIIAVVFALIIGISQLIQNYIYHQSTIKMAFANETEKVVNSDDKKPSISKVTNKDKAEEVVSSDNWEMKTNPTKDINSP